jgi:hypothetical protein
MGSQCLPVDAAEERFTLLPPQKDQIETDLSSFAADSLISAVLADLTNQCLQKRAATLAATPLEQLSGSTAST